MAEDKDQQIDKEDEATIEEVEPEAEAAPEEEAAPEADATPEAEAAPEAGAAPEAEAEPEEQPAAGQDEPAVEVSGETRDEERYAWGAKLANELKVDKLSARLLMDLDACSRCGECVMWCPVFAQDQNIEITPRDKAKSLVAILNRQYGLRAQLFGPDGFVTKLFGEEAGARLGKLFKYRPPTEEDLLKFADALYECSTCGQCHILCPSDLDTVEIWEGVRRCMVDSGYGPLPSQSALATSVKGYDNPWMQPRAARAKWAKRAFKDGELIAEPKDASKEQVDVLYFVGCTASYDVNIRQVAINTCNVLSHFGVNYGILGTKEKCCGSVLLRVGDYEFERLASENIEIFNKLGIKTLISSCAGCFKTIKQDYPKVGELNFEVLHMVEFLTRLHKEGKIEFGEPLNIDVTYHDPCHLGRANQIYDAPRYLLNALGANLIEMERVKENSRCCGAGGGLKAGFTEIQAQMSQERVKEAERTGATEFVTACPFCYQGLLEGITALDSPLPMRDINELIIKSIGDQLVFPDKKKKKKEKKEKKKLKLKGKLKKGAGESADAGEAEEEAPAENDAAPEENDTPQEESI